MYDESTLRRFARVVRGVAPSLTAFLKEREQELRLVEPHRVLELGVGEGRHLLAFRGKGWDIHGIDVDPVALQIARYISDNRNLEVQLHEGSCDDLSRFADASFNLVFSHRALQNTRDIGVVTRTLAEVRRVLVPGGFYFLSENCSPKIDFADRQRRTEFLTQDEIRSFSTPDFIILRGDDAPIGKSPNVERVGGFGTIWEVVYRKK